MSTATMTPALSTGGELRLTPRGRRVVWAAAVLLAGGALLTGGRAVADAPSAPVAVDTYTVASGETLWSIAVSLTAPGQDVRDTVDHLAALNNRPSSTLLAGEQILVPVPE